VCTFAVTPVAVPVEAEGGQLSLTVQASSANCTWTATSPVSWIAVAPASGTASGSVRLTVQGNTTGLPRTATVLVAGQPVVVSQPPATVQQGEVRLEGTVSQVSGSCPALSFRLEGRTVQTSPATHFVADRCDRVRSGATVDVRGELQSTGVVLATRVMVRQQ